MLLYVPLGGTYLWVEIETALPADTLTIIHKCIKKKPLITWYSLNVLSHVLTRKSPALSENVFDVLVGILDLLELLFLKFFFPVHDNCMCILMFQRFWIKFWEKI